MWPGGRSTSRILPRAVPVTCLLLAALFLPISHFGISSTRLRDVLVSRIGEQGYLGLYSLVTVAAFWWLIAAYRGAPGHPLWHAPPAVRSVAFVVVLLAFLITVIGVATPNPTTVGAEKLFERAGVVSGILLITRNPFLWGVGLWGTAHIVATGDAASLMLFGSLVALSLGGSLLIDAKKARRHGAQWQGFAALSSNVPFQAIIEGRQQLRLDEIGWWRIMLAGAVFLAALTAHRWAFGVSPLPMF